MAIARPQPRTKMVLEAAGVVLDRMARTVTVAGQPCAVRPRCFFLLEVLLSKPGFFFTEDEIRSAMREYGDSPTPLRHTAHWLRRDLGDAGVHIQFQRNSGYIFALEPVRG